MNVVKHILLATCLITCSSALRMEGRFAQGRFAKNKARVGAESDTDPNRPLPKFKELAEAITEVKRASVATPSKERVPVHAGGAIANEIQNCESEHPIFHTQQQAWTTKELFDCYKTWHEAKLAALRQNKNCDSKPPLFVVKVDHGLGDSGNKLLINFQRAFQQGRMIQLVFFDQGQTSNAWKMAMDAPFSWDLRANNDTLCFSEQDIDTVGEGPLGDAQAPNNDKVHFDESDYGDLWFLLMPPKAEVLQLVDSVMSQVKQNEKLVGIHFRSQYTHAHFACGCNSLLEMPKCVGNMKSFVVKQGVSGWDTSKVRLFVASDQENGISAFERAFGKQDILKISNTYPIEHSLDCTDEGAIRIYADLIILSRADVMLGSCGSTFSQLAHKVSHRSSNLSVLTGSPAAEQCASMVDEKRDLSGFVKEQFVDRSDNMMSCNCYAPGEKGSGVCKFACEKSLQRPSKCDAFSNNLQMREFNKPATSRYARDPMLYFHSTALAGKEMAEQQNMHDKFARSTHTEQKNLTWQEVHEHAVDVFPLDRDDDHPIFQASICSEKTLIYHTDAMAPYGFGNQFNHINLAHVLGLLTSRRTTVEGSRTLGCPGAASSGPSCYLHVQERKESESDKKWKATLQKGGSVPTRFHEMMEDSDACDWHADGDMVRWIEWSTVCNTPVTEITRAICKSTSSEHIELALLRYTAQNQIFFVGKIKEEMEAAKELCMQQADGKKTLGIHVRRTDKVNHEDRLYHVHEYIEAAKKQHWDFDTVFIMTDDPQAVKKEADELNLNYFVVNEALPIKADNVGFLREVACMTIVPHFVGSAKSNVPWLIQQLRNQPFDSAIDLNSGQALLTVP